MPNPMKELKSEISRLARKEAKQVVAPVQRASANYRGLIAGLRKQIDALQGEVASLRRAAPKADGAFAAAQEPQGRFWITGKGVRALRKRLGLTQAQFGKLVGVSVPTIVNWEKVDGKVEIRRKATMARLQELKGKGKREVAAMLGDGKNAEPKAKAKRKAGATKKIKRFDLLKDLGKPVAGKVEPKAKVNSNAKSKAKKT